MSDIKYKVLRVMADGEIVLVGDDGEKSHGETVYCKADHNHSKQCAKDLLDVKDVLVSAAVEEETDEKGKVIVAAKPEVRSSPRDRINEWFAVHEPAAKAVELPTKSVQVKEGKKTVTREVEDQDLE